MESPIHMECLTGHYEGQFIAKAYAKFAVKYPVTPEEVIHNVVNCQLCPKKTETLTIHQNCFMEDFEKFYIKHFFVLKEKMLKKGFSYDKKHHKFVRTEEKVINTKFIVKSSE